MSAAPALRVRLPTGQVAWPLVLIEGLDKVGKSSLAYELSTSPRVDRTFVADLGEGTADEYRDIGPYELLVHDGTFTSLFGQLQAATAVPSADDKPNVIILDDGSKLWKLIKRWTNARARNSAAGKRTIQRDPDGDVDVPMNLWNDAADRWSDVVDLLRDWPGVAVVIAQGQEVSKVENGQPVRGETEWTIEAHKSTRGEVSAIVRVGRDHRATLLGVRKRDLQLPAAGLLLPAEGALDHLVFALLGVGGFGQSQRVIPSLADMPSEAALAPVEHILTPDEQARADGWADEAEGRAEWRALREASAAADPIARSRTRQYKEAEVAGQSKAAHTAVAAALEYFVAHRAAQIERGEAPFSSSIEEAEADREALAGYAADLARQQAEADPGRPY